MRKIFLLLLIAVLSGCTDEFRDDAEGKQTQTDTRSASDQRYDTEALASLFEEDVRLLGDPTRSYADYRSSREFTPFVHTKVMTLSSNPGNLSGIHKILILVNSSVYGSSTAEIERYACDINFAYGCQTVMETVSGGDHTHIKDLILSNQTNLNGVVFIGDIPAAWFETANDHNKYGYSSWPCDLYYMDMDGTWADTDGNSIYDSHTGNTDPEIFIGRISTKNMGTLLSEEAGLKRYLDKNHRFWNGSTTVNRRSALSYVDKDWVPFDYYKTDIRHLYGSSNYESKGYGDPGFGRADYLSRLKDKTYEFIQLASHASYSRLAMSDGSVYANEIFNNGAEAIGYNLFCCSACNWTAISPSSAYGFVAGAHVYNAKNKSLVVVGSTKTGSMLEFANFYTPLGQGKTIGESLETWWRATQKTGTNKISWYYGMTIIGDPLVNFFHRANDRAENQITLNGFDLYNTGSHRYIAAREVITANNYAIPADKHVIFDAPQIILNSGFECHAQGSFEIN